VSRPDPEPPSAQSSFARHRSYRRRGGLVTSSMGFTPSSSLLRTHVSVPAPPTASVLLDLVRQVFAGCSQPLLGTAPSRRYLCESFLGCLDPYPGGPRGASARFFPLGVGLPYVKTRSALHNAPYSDFRTAAISGLQSFANVQAPSLARPPGCAYRCAEHRAAGPFTSRYALAITRASCDIATYLKWTN